jgi:hypothetical protein
MFLCRLFRLGCTCCGFIAFWAYMFFIYGIACLLNSLMPTNYPWPTDDDWAGMLQLTAVRGPYKGLACKLSY